MWTATNQNLWATTISDPDYLPYFYVIADSGLILEADDGEIEEFHSQELADAAAAQLNRRR